MGDNIQWPDNGALIEALKEGLQQNATYFRPFFLALFEANLIFPQASGPKHDAKGNLLYSPLQTELEGQGALLAFTDEASLKRALPQEQWLIILPARTICQMALQIGFSQIAINARGPVGHLLRTFEIQAIADGQIPVGPNQVEWRSADAPIQIGHLRNDLKDATRSALRALCAENGVNEMWWFGVSVAGGRAHHALSVSPSSPELRARLGAQIEPLWRQLQAPDAPPDEPLFDLYGLDQIRPSITEGERIFPE